MAVALVCLLCFAVFAALWLPAVLRRRPSLDSRRISSLSALPDRARLVVLGCHVADAAGRPNRLFTARVAAGAAAYHALVARGDDARATVLASGFGRLGETEALRTQLIAAGVPAEAIELDPNGERTIRTIEFLARDDAKDRPIVLVSQAFHLARSLWLAERLGVDARGLAAAGGIEARGPAPASTWRGFGRSSIPRARSPACLHPTCGMLRLAPRSRSLSTECPWLRKTRRERRSAGPSDSRDCVRAERIELHLDLDPGKRRFRGRAGYELVLEDASSWIELHAVELDVRNVRAHVAGRSVDAAVEPHPECETIVLRFASRLPPATSASISTSRVASGTTRGLYRGSDPPSLPRGPALPDRCAPPLPEPRRARHESAVCDRSDRPGGSVRPRERARRRPEPPARRPDLVLRGDAAALRLPRRDRRRPLRGVSGRPGRGDTDPCRHAAWEPTPRALRTRSGDRESRPAREVVRDAASLREARSVGLAGLRVRRDGERRGGLLRDSVLLLDEKTASAEDRLRAAETIAHELAHMWFGNPVTMAWWNDLWLNESFATWMAYEIVDDWQPDWSIWHEFVNRRETALELDALPSSHPIAPPVQTADEAQENFDAITYTKGAAVLRMLERFLGRRAFRDGVRRYIRRHREGAAVAADLWQALQDASGVPVGKIVGPWTQRTGYPLLSVRAGRDGRVSLEQTRFGLLPRKRWADEPAWTVPWIGRVGRGRKGRLERAVLTRRRTAVLGPAPSVDWLYANADEAGFFRIEHGNDGPEALLDRVGALAATERIGWVGHQWALVRTGRADVGSLLDLIAAHRDEHEPEVLLAIERVLGALLRRLAPEAGDGTAERLRGWIALQFGDQIGELGLRAKRSESFATTRRRARVLSIVGDSRRAGGSQRAASTRRGPISTGGFRSRAAPSRSCSRSPQARTNSRCRRRSSRRPEVPEARALRRPLFALAGHRPGSTPADLEGDPRSRLAPASIGRPCSCRCSPPPRPRAPPGRTSRRAGRGSSGRCLRSCWRASPARPRARCPSTRRAGSAPSSRRIPSQRATVCSVRSTRS